MDMTQWNVLLVDDEEDFVATLAERLSLRGVNTRVALDGEQALARVAEAPPQVAVVDVMMPGMRGLEVLRRIRQGSPGVQVILLTGQGTARDGIEGMHEGAFDYMMKPIDIDALIGKLSEAVKAAEAAGYGGGGA
jgi:DNA-binding NtrC family response regulator